MQIFRSSVVQDAADVHQKAVIIDARNEVLGIGGIATEPAGIGDEDDCYAPLVDEREHLAKSRALTWHRARDAEVVIDDDNSGIGPPPVTSFVRESPLVFGGPHVFSHLL